MSIYTKKKIYFIIGPTGSGKTALSINLAKKILNPEIISADSRQVFKDLNISSGKITKEEMENIPHHLLDMIEPGQYFSVVDYTNLAVQKIEEIFGRGNMPVIVGGTAFYIDSLLYKYNLPELKKDENLRKELEAKNLNELQEILKEISPSTNNYLEKFKTKEFANNRHRLIRTIEIIKTLGYIPELKKELRFNKEEYQVEIINTVDNLDRKNLKEKIKKRTLQRLEAGMLEEIKQVKNKYKLSDKYIKSLGFEYSLSLDFINEKIGYEKFLEEFVNKEYQYARRQETWFKRYTSF